MTNYAAPQDNGHSVVFDAVTYPIVDGEAQNTLIVKAGESEGVYLATFDMDNIRAYRERESWGNAYRRPRLYKALIAEEAEPPFIRQDATR
jgi:predicted amidohydrolase